MGWITLTISESDLQYEISCHDAGLDSSQSQGCITTNMKNSSGFVEFSLVSYSPISVNKNKKLMKEL